MIKTKNKIISFSIIAVILIAILVGNIVCSAFFQMITEFFHGTGVSFDNEQLEEVLNSGDDLCSEIEGEGVIMLKNTANTPPLKDVTKVNLFGWATSDAGWTISGYGSGEGRIVEEKKVKLQKAFTESNIEYNAELAQFYKDFRNERTGLTSLAGGGNMCVVHQPEMSAYDAIGAGGHSIMDNAVAYSDTAIVAVARFLGEQADAPTTQKRDNKGTYPDGVINDSSRQYLELTVEEENLINAVKEKFENVIILLNTTNSMEVGFIDDDKIDSAYWVGAPGQSGTRAIPKILKGEINPSGRTTATWAYDLSTDASYANAANRGVYNTKITYVEDVYVGYRWYETADAEGFWDSEFAKTKWNIQNGYEDVVQFPFGYGLSYTNFTWEFASIDDSLALSPEEGTTFSKEDKIKVKVKVTNTGTVKGKDVVQLYYQPPYKENGIEKSVISLATFAKTAELEPNQSQFLTLEFSPYVMASYDAYDKNYNRFAGYELDMGDYTICLGRNVHDIVKSFTYSLNKSIKYREDPKTGTKVVNQFTGNTAYANSPIDNIQNNSELTYTTRSDFSATFHTSRFNVVENSEVTNYISDKKNTTETYQLGVENDLRLFVDKDGNKLSADLLKNPKGDSVFNNEELMMELGEKYGSEKWDLLLDQMSINDMLRLIVLGGYQTESIESVGKIWMRENDGPMGLTRGNASPNEVSNWTWYPMVGVLAATWNTRIAYRFGNIVSNEARLTGVHGWYAPGFNIIRSPLGGRNNEYYSEDPILSASIGSQTVLAALNNGVSCYIKHFIVNETESSRRGLRTYLTEQALREIYLKPFEYAVKNGKANGVMTSFNRLGDIWTGGVYALNTTILREEWGFKGGVITDWFGAGDVDLMNTTQGIKAGNDLWLNGMGSLTHNLDTNDVTIRACMRDACKNVLYQVCNTYYMQQTHNAEDDEYVVNVGIVDVERPFPYWIFLLIGIDVIAFGGCGVWTYFIVRKKRK